MCPPTTAPLKNLYISSNFHKLDQTSKVLLIAGAVLGVNRLNNTLVNKLLWKTALFFYSAFVLGLTYYCLLKLRISLLAYIVVWNQVVGASINIFFSLIGAKKFDCIFKSFQDLDTGMRYRLNHRRVLVYNIGAYILTAFVACCLVVALLQCNLAWNMAFCMAISHLNFYSEMLLLSHMIVLLRVRLEAITKRFVNLMHSKSLKAISQYNRNPKVDLIKVFECYDMFFDLQMRVLSAIQGSFLVQGGLSLVDIAIKIYTFIDKQLSNFENDMSKYMVYLAFSVVWSILGLALPCASAEGLLSETRRLRAHLCAHAEQNLDKKEKAHMKSLRYKLKEGTPLRMIHLFDLDVSLLFKSIGFLMTYVIILIQCRANQMF